MRISNNIILITGGATGIGLGLAERFLKEGNKVIVCGRREQALEAARLKFPSIITHRVDLEIESERIALFKWIRENHPDCNVLINNAGIQLRSSLADDDFFAKARQEIAINVEAPIHLTSLFLKLGKLSAVLNVTSGLAFVPLVELPVYCATKSFLHNFNTSLTKLLSQRKIEVIEIIPPGLNTELGGKGLHDHFPPVSDFIESIFLQLKEGKTRLTFGMSEMVSKADPEALEIAFNRMNSKD
jgi:uncharacterized oxidoreductase